MSQKAPSGALRVLLVLIAVTVILYFGRSFLLPLAFGGFLAMVFYPLMLKLRKRGIPDWGGISVAVLILILIIGLIGGVTFFQTRSLVKDWPQIRSEIKKKQEQTENYLIKNVGIVSEDRIEKTKKRIGEQRQQFQSMATSLFGSFFSSITGILLAFVYMAIFLWEEDRLFGFVKKLTPNESREKVAEGVKASRKVVSQYLIGRVILIGILAVFYSIGFLIFGLNYAIPIAILAAILSIIPYIGNVIGGAFAITIALATGGTATTMLGVLGTMVVAQILESNILTPWIMGDRVALNPLATVAGVIGFGIIWGVPGTILAIPVLGVLKTAFNRIPSLEPYGYLMGFNSGN